ncbi:lariat debranching enzyme, C-terminal domain-containing protein [Cercophora samala]|uniref:Lariat debranching enzyme, C-terminal domain-containing protein n=1 Tax=Cercophora samala TaxID=330535 RepID=A0AA39ZHX1_9PEZI|nr:lariat debranching enzyme, C-terminal domain-containing protein [Cercophora samala]
MSRHQLTLLATHWAPRQSLLLLAAAQLQTRLKSTKSLARRGVKSKQKKRKMSDKSLRVAIEGCGHGTLNAIYSSVTTSCKERNWDGVDVLIIGGDFQAVRNADDLTVMSVPARYRELGDFPDYYSGKRKAPYLTIFVAGNHEAASHLAELHYGGWVAPNIYYMGAANILRLGPIRIAGMSGIWKVHDYRKPHHERLPFNQSDIKSFYHVREIDIRKLLQVRTQVDIGISHDWPRGIEKHGDADRLWKMKPDFQRESHDGSLGNPAADYVLNRLRPPYWFSAHLHCKYSALKMFDPPTTEPQPAASETTPGSTPAPPAAPAHNPDEIDLDLDDEEPPAAPAQNPDEIDLDLDDEETAAVPPTGSTPVTTTSTQTQPDEQQTDALRSLLPSTFSKPTPHIKTTPGQPVPRTITNTATRFLALDKCLPGRAFLQLMEIPSSTPITRPVKLSYDKEWLSILRAFHPLIKSTFGVRGAQVPEDKGEEYYLGLIKENEQWVKENLVKKGKMGVPENFEVTAPVMDEGRGWERGSEVQPREYTNPQTARFCELLGVENYWDASEEEREERREKGPDKDEFNGGFRGGRGGGGGYRGRGGGGGGHRGGGGGGGYRGGGRGGGGGYRGRGGGQF